MIWDVKKVGLWDLEGEVDWNVGTYGHHVIKQA